ncbi:MAG TPA: hypothetical protein VD838_21650, partial [Anaeromyxobacteraceae bacterium]|nr:hypothetical protein [Anaeromyxobacteraceae bacterium]
MGVDVHVTLIDRRAYVRLAEVHRRWVEERDAGAALSLLREALERVRKLAPFGKTRLQRMDEIGRRIDALPTTPQDEEDGARFEQSIQEATRRAFAARALGDSAAEAQEMEKVSRTLFGAMFAPLGRSDERGALMRELHAINQDPPGPEIELVEELESAIAAFSDHSLTPEQRDLELSWGCVLNAYAFAWDREPRADVVVDLLLGFEDSNVLEDLVGYAKGDDIPLDESARFFTDEQVASFRDDLARIPVPAPKAPERVARVRRLVELAASDPAGL